MSEEDEISSKRAKGPLDVSRRALLIGAGSTAALLGLGALRYAGHNPCLVYTSMSRRTGAWTWAPWSWATPRATCPWKTRSR